MNINQIIANLDQDGKTGSPAVDRMLSRGFSLKEILDNPLINIHPGACPGESLNQTCARLMNERQR